MTLTTTIDQTTLTIAIEGSIDTVTAPELEVKLRNATAGMTALILDFTGVDYISSAGLRVLIATEQAFSDQGTMTLKNVNEDVRAVFEMTGFDELFTLE